MKVHKVRIFWLRNKALMKDWRRMKGIITCRHNNRVQTVDEKERWSTR